VSGQCATQVDNVKEIKALRLFLESGSVRACRVAIFDIQRRKLSVDDKIVIVERKRTRNAVGIKFEADGISRRLLCIVVVRFAALEITDGDRPAWHRSKLRLSGRRVVVIALVRLNLVADYGERVEDFVSGFRTVIDRKA